MNSTGISKSQVFFSKGKVEYAIPGTVPDSIVLLRLDTSWYESTAHELKHLYHRIVSRGVLIIDDYGYWEGCRVAVDEFIRSMPFRPMLHRINYTGRILINALV